jgi:hypothetical protein
MGWCRYVIKAPIMNGYRHSGKLVRQELRKGEVVRGNEHFVPTAMKLREKSTKSVTMNATCRARGLLTYFHTRDKRRHRGREIALISTRRIRKLDSSIK